MSTYELESINSELFESFDPEQELWIIGGSTINTTTAKIIYSPGPNGQVAAMMDYDISWT